MSTWIWIWLMNSYSRDSSKHTAAAAKSLQSCPTLCDSIDVRPLGSPSLGFSRQEHWSGLPFPSPMLGKWKVKVKTLSRVHLLVRNSFLLKKKIFLVKIPNWHSTRDVQNQRRYIYKIQNKCTHIGWRHKITLFQYLLLRKKRGIPY